MEERVGFPKLFMTDLDDTALGGGFKPYSRFPDVFSTFLDRLVSHGCQWATNTTWDVYPQMQMIFSSAVRSRPAYLVGGKGLQMCRVHRDELVSVQPYSEQMEKRMEEVNKHHFRPMIREICTLFELKSISYNGFWFSTVAVDHDAKALLAYADKKAKASGVISFNIIPERNQIAAFPAFLKKSDALREILRITGLKPDEVVVAGDGIIDLDMMSEELCGYVLCPANAHSDVKELVRKRNGVIGGSDCGPGVVEAFETLARLKGWDW